MKTRAGEIHPSYNPQKDPSLFRESRGKLLLQAIKDRTTAIFGRTGEQESQPFNKMLDDLVEAADYKQWPHWRYSERSSERLRIFTPPFAKEKRNGHHVLTRLHIALPDAVSPQPIAHIEKVVFGEGDTQVFTGQEIIWHYGSSQRPLMDIGMDEQRLNVSPDSHVEFWDSAVRMVTAAHAELIG
jgi:hypothetical protein